MILLGIFATNYLRYKYNIYIYTYTIIYINIYILEGFRTSSRPLLFPSDRQGWVKWGGKWKNGNKNPPPKKNEVFEDLIVSNSGWSFVQKSNFADLLEMLCCSVSGWNPLQKSNFEMLHCPTSDWNLTWKIYSKMIWKNNVVVVIVVLVVVFSRTLKRKMLCSWSQGGCSCSVLVSQPIQCYSSLYRFKSLPLILRPNFQIRCFKGT